jgi:hypothetical protein
MRHHLVQGDLALAALGEFGQMVGDAVHEGELAFFDQGPHRAAGQHLGLAEQQEQRTIGRRFVQRLGLGDAIGAEERQLAVPRQRDLRPRISALLDVLPDQPVEVLQRRRGKAEARRIGGCQGIAVGHGDLLAIARMTGCYMTRGISTNL